MAAIAEVAVTGEDLEAALNEILPAARGEAAPFIAEQLGNEYRVLGVGVRERSALDGADGSRAVDALWRWLERELSLGELRVLLELSLIRQPLVQDAARRVAEARCRAAGRTA